MPTPCEWTPDTILDAIHAWVTAHHGHFLSQAALMAPGLPSKHQVYMAFGPMPAVKRAYEARYGSRAGIAQCPRCGERWWSPDRYDQLQHSYAARKAGHCRVPGQPRFSHRRHPRVQPVSEAAPPEHPPLIDPYKVLVRDLLDEALMLLAEAIPQEEAVAS